MEQFCFQPACFNNNSLELYQLDLLFEEVFELPQNSPERLRPPQYVCSRGSTLVRREGVHCLNKLYEIKIHCLMAEIIP